jgi:phosphoserine phosphatase
VRHHAANEFVTAPIAQRFGIEHLIATLVGAPAKLYRQAHGRAQPARARSSVWTSGWPRAAPGCPDFPRSTFYSDSANDIALLERSPTRSPPT